MRRFVRLVVAVCRQLLVLREGSFALRYAIRNGDLRLVRKLITHKVPNRRTFFGEDPLTLASRLGRASIVRRLVEDAGLNSTARCACALRFAADIGSAETVSVLVAAIIEKPGGSSSHEARLALDGGLVAAAAAGHVGICRFLLDSGAEVNFRDGGPKGYTSLMYAIMHGYLEITKELLQRGADVNAIAVNDDSAIEMAVMDCDLEVLKLLLEAGASVELPARHGTLLDLAIACQCREIATFLEAKGVSNARS